MQIILNAQGYVEAYALVGGFGSPSVTVDEPENLDDFENNYRSYYLSEDNKLVKDNNKQIEIENNQILNELRSKRGKECFPYVNRGELWYSRLSTEQKAELDTWYQAWLDVTETKAVPTAPDWLN